MDRLKVILGMWYDHVPGRTSGLFAVVFCLLLSGSPLFAQGTFGRIMGTVTDQSGGSIANATVTVTDTERGVSKTLTTNDAGEYNAPNLVPSTYKVRAEAKGFAVLERSNIVVEVAKEVRIDVVLQPGTQEQTVTVSEAVPLVETSNATLGGTLENAEINDMPLNGRNFQNLLALRPGVALQPGGGPWTQSTNGVRPDESGWLLEGVINVNFYDARPIANMPSPFTDAATILPIDAIQEFNTEENPKAEYGWKPGAVVNVGIKSGTNNYHGSAYAFGRSDSWASRNYFNPAPDNGVCGNSSPHWCDKLPTSLEQFGGMVGGPIKKDKLFFFGGYEGLRSLVGNAIVGNSPQTQAQSTASPKNSMVDAITALQEAGVPRSIVSEKIAGCTGDTNPLQTAGPFGTVTCNGGLFPNNTGGSKAFTSTFPNSNQSDNGVGKIDYHINDKNTLYGFALVSYYNALGEDHPFLNSAFEDWIPMRTYTASGAWDWTPNSKMVNEVKFAYDKVLFDFYPADANVIPDGTGYPVNTGVLLSGAPGGKGGFPNVNITGYSSLGTQHNRPFYFHNPYYDGQDTLSYLMGKHSLKFGVEIAHIQVNNASFETARGRIDFRGGGVPSLSDCVDSNGNPTSCPLEDFFAGAPNRGFLLNGNPARSSSWNSFAGFAQDDWRLTPKVTLNLGLRYSYVSPPKEANGLFGSFTPSQGMVDQSALGGTLWKPDYKDFSPRLGFAWDVTGRGTTVVRGGFNIMYSTYTIATLLQEVNFQNTTAVSIAAVPTGACNQAVSPGGSCPTGQTYGGTITLANNKIPGGSLNWDPSLPVSNSTLNSGKVFPTGTVTSCTDTSPCNIMAVDPNLTTPFVEAWNFGITHSFNSNLSLEVEYVGTHGARLTGFRDINQLNQDGSLSALGQQYQYLGFINYFSNDTVSNYNGLQTTLTERTSHGLSFVMGYTYSHGLDNGSLNRNGFLPQDSNNPMLDYSSGDFDMRHRFTLTTSYDIPGIKGYGQMLEGWKLNAIISVQTGQPWTVWDQGNNFSSSFSNNASGGDNTDRWDFTGDPNSFKSQGANSLPYCQAGACTVTSGVTGASWTLSNSAALWNLCVADAAGTTTGLNPTSNLVTGVGAGCFVSADGKAVMTPPATGKFGNMPRNYFRDLGFHNVDFSVFKNFTIHEKYGVQFRAEFFNIFNTPEFANPYGSVAGYGVGNDPGTQQGTFGCGCATPDVMAGNPLVGSGSARTIQLGLKLLF